MHKCHSYLFILGWLLFNSCAQKDSSQTTLAVQYPNEDAPLALLMREVFLDLEEIKFSVEQGENIKSYLKRHKEILVAHPTNPVVKTATFEMMGNAYLESLKRLEESPKSQLSENYKVLISSCLGCHQQYCPGPIKRIQLLNLGD